METETKKIASEPPAIPDFETFLKSKKIDPVTFKKDEEAHFQELQELYDQVHPNSFVQQKLFLINGIRRKYQLKEEEIKAAMTPTKKVKPKMSIKPKLK